MSLQVWLPLTKDTNVISEIATLSKESSITITEDTNGWYKIADSSHTSGRWGTYYSFSVKPNTQYTLQVYSKSTTGVSASIGIQSYIGSSSWPAVRDTNNSSTEKLTTYTWKTGVNDTTARVYLAIGCTSTTANNYVFYKGLKVYEELKNQGFADINTINNKVTYSGNGKIGQGCYYFNRSNPSYFKIENSITNIPNGISMAFWVKLPSNGSVNDQLVHIGNGSGWANNRFTCFVRGNTSTLIFCCGDGTNSTQYNCVSSALALNEWTHVACTYEANKMRIYLNGVLNKEYTTSFAPSFNNVSYIGVGAGPNVTEPVTAYLNDIRIYNHCLSQSEIKKLSQGLIVHYPLNRNGWGQENLATCATPQYNLSASTGNYNYFWIAGAGTLTIGKTYTVSAEVTVSDNIEKCTIYNYHTNPTTGGPQYNYFPADGKRHSWTFTASATGLLGYCGVAGATANHTAIYRNIKIEEGEIATPYTPRSNETLYTIMGLNSTTEYDCSGFCNNGTKTGIFTWTNNTPKYVVSQDCIGTNYIHLTPPSTEVRTIAIWVNWKTIPSGQSVILVDNGSGIGLGLMNTGILCSTSGAGGSYTFSKSNLVANTWYHFVVVKTGTTTRKLYINGIEQTATSNTSNWTFAVNELQLGKRSTTSDGFIGKLSDFRAYVTALSNLDVLELYNMGHAETT